MGLLNESWPLPVPSPPGPKTSPSARPGCVAAAGDVVTPLAKRSLFWSLAHHSGQGNKR